MKYSTVASIGLVLILSLLSSNIAARADEPEEGKVKPMFEEGKFKCTDGYDPDTDASLHPPGQDSRTRQFINENERVKHEKQIEQQTERKPEEQNSSGSAEKPIAVTPQEAKPEDQKEKDKEKEKNKEKNGSEKVKAEDKEKEKKEAEKPVAQSGEPKSPLSQAVFAIQSRNYQDSLKFLNLILAKDQKNQQAHYLMAVSYVGLRKYDEAREQYNIVVKSNSDPKLVQMASQGLAKIPVQH